MYIYIYVLRIFVVDYDELYFALCKIIISICSSILFYKILVGSHF